MATTVVCPYPSSPIMSRPFPSSSRLNDLATITSLPHRHGRLASAVAPAPPAPARATRRGASSNIMACDPAELRRVFELFDRDGDGRITREELTESLERLGLPVPEEELAATIARIDANGDGCVDMDEFGELYEAIMRGDGGQEEEADMREAFNVFDKNGDGFITVDELGAVLASLGIKQGRTLEDCRRMIGQVDMDGDGRVDFLEFKQMMRGGGFAALGC